MPTPSHNPIRVGVVALTDLDDPNPLSGMPYRMVNALRDQGIEIVPISAELQTGTKRSSIDRAARRAQSIHTRRTPLWAKRFIDELMPNRARQSVLDRAAAHSNAAQRSLQSRLDAGESIDALFGCCASFALCSLETELPIISFSDATASVLEATYRVRAKRGNAYRKALREIDRQALANATISVFPTPIIQSSAIKDLGVDPARTRVVPMGAHVYPDNPESITAPSDAPSRGSCKLLIVAADPIRKRVDLATEATEILRTRGINATLHVIGKGTAKSNSSEAVDPVGPLKLSDQTDRATHQALLRSCHIQVLPSLGEAFGISPIESAHFARPSIVSDAGGLPFVVLDGKTGMVLPIHAPANAWADAIEALTSDPDKYRTQSAHALKRAREELNWDAWGARIKQLIQEQIRLI